MSSVYTERHMPVQLYIWSGFPGGCLLTIHTVVILNAKPLKTETWAEVVYGLENDSENKEKLKEYDWESWLKNDK